MIDLHLHTTASDGALRPADLVARAAATGITTLSVTDHDTVGGLDEAHEAARSRDLEFVNGIEITAVEGGRDVHVLGYFFDPGNRRLARFLAAQRDDRVRRVREMADRLDALGFRIDADTVVRQGLDSGRSVGRPHVAEALLAAGHVRTRDEAFDRFLESSRPAFVARRGAPVGEVIRIIHAAGGVVSMAHPALTGVDHLIPSFVASGIDALEARHGDHDAAAETRYRALAATHGVAVSGGSDFHSDNSHRRCALGAIALPPEDFQSLKSRAR